MSFRSLTFSLAAVLGAALAAPGLAQNASRVINYQGELANPDGTPFADGNYPMTFRIYDVPTAGAAHWEEVLAAPVPVVSGKFNVSLGAGTALPPSAFNGAARYLEIMVDGTTIEPRQVIATAPYAMHAYNGVPIGTVIDWWRPGGSDFPIPDGFKICDGTEVMDEASPFLGSRVPNLREKFVRGVQDLASISPGGASKTGGANSHQIKFSDKTESVGGHTHSVNPGRVDTSSSGAHSHNWLRWTKSNRRFVSYKDNGTALTILSHWGSNDGIGLEGSGSYVMRKVATEDDFIYTTSNAGNHTHSVDIPAVNTTSSGAHSHDFTVEATVPTVPEYVGLLKLIKIK